jgi:hypothetical protein
MTVHDTHGPLGDYFGALAQAGLLVERVVEPVPDVLELDPCGRCTSERYERSGFQIAQSERSEDGIFAEYLLRAA